jgi:glycerol uptake facilitator-like aquaporin
VNFTSSQRLAAELIGTAAITAVVLGAGHMAKQLGADSAQGLLINGLATAAALFLLISIFASVSGAHFNPIVSFAMLLRRQISLVLALGYVLAQVIGAVLGAVIANAMFAKSLLGPSAVVRDGAGVYLGEIVASFGLLLVILLLSQQDKGHVIPAAVALWIFAGYFFTASTSFANPAVTFGRTFSDASSSISLQSVPMFIGMQFVGALLAVGVAHLLRPKTGR